MKKLSLLFVLLIALFAVYSCNKPSGTHYTIDADLISKFEFQPGSYWVYTDSLTSVVDSFYVKVPPNSYSENNNGVTVDYIGIGIYDMNVSNLWFLGLSTNYLNLTWSSCEGCAVDTIVQYPVLISYPFLPGTQTAKYYGTWISYIDTIMSVFVINGNSFYNVAHVIIPNSRDKTFDDFYLNDSVGIIKMRLRSPEFSQQRIWELQRWHIVK